ncbi:5-aminolevulinate synthase [Ophiobolus disseminans]|uniref:5-aminolevulinate synthase n=1 Tax=Ophiobolus disseminans TaxID=1469910 RepID=A0A6A7A7Y0_9PLEO|nr:5-aminolevulinate synthase [Ophiobolus disseminans]
MKTASPFYRNLEDALDARRKSHTFYTITQTAWQITDTAADFCSNDILSFGSSGILSAEYLEELARLHQANPGAAGSRLADGNYAYLEETEQHIANFHGAETALLLASGFEANVAIWTAIPRPGDMILYDALVHASTHEGIEQSLAGEREEFAHNNIRDFRRVLTAMVDAHPLIKQGKRSVLIAVESVYSMDGDVCPLQELIDAANELCPLGNAQFVVDEAHSNGIYGPGGKGLVCALGLEKEVAVVMHSYGKALSSRGAAILGNETIKSVLLNFARTVIFTTAPSFSSIALIRSAYRLLDSAHGIQAQVKVHSLVDLFMQSTISHPLWESASQAGILSVPLLRAWEESSLATSHIVTIRSRQQYTYWLHFHLLLAGYCVLPVEYPVVSKGQSRLKVTFHAGNPEEQVKGLVQAIFAWVQEITDIEGRKGNSQIAEVSKSAQQVYTWMASEKLTGFGMPSSWAS